MKKHRILYLLLCALFCSASGFAQMSIDNIGTIFLDNSGQVTSPGIVNHGLIKIKNGGLLRINDEPGLRGDFQNDGTLDAEVGGVVEFCATNATQTYSYSLLPDDAKFGGVLMNAKGLELDNHLLLKPGAALTFGNAMTPNTIRTKENRVWMLTTLTTVSSIANYQAAAESGSACSTGGASVGGFQNNYIIGNLRWQVSPIKSTYEFPVGDDESLQYMEMQFSGSNLWDGEARAFDGRYDTTVMSFVLHDACSVTGMTRYTGIWQYDLHRDSAGTDPLDTLSTGEYTFISHPRNFTTDVSSSFYSAGVHHSRYPTLPDTIYKVAGDATGTNCYNSNNACRITLVKMNKFSKVAGIQNQSPFPVEFISLQAKPLENRIKVSWESATEQDVAYYQVERSTDGILFAVIASAVKSKEGAGKNGWYDHVDADVTVNHRYFYRIRQVDNNTKTSLSKMVEAMIQRVDGNELSATLYPNPTNGDLVLGVAVGNDQDIEVSMYDMMGKRVVHRWIRTQLGASTFDLSDDVRRLSSGAYTATIKTDFKVVTQKVILAE